MSVYKNAKIGITIVATKKLFSRGMLGLVMVLVEYESNGNWLRVSERVRWMVLHSDCKHLRRYYLQCTRVWPIPNQWLWALLSLSITVIPAHPWGKQSEIKIVSVHTILICSLGSWHSLNWLFGRGMRKDFWCGL